MFGPYVYAKFEEAGISVSGKPKIWLVKNAKSDFEIGRIRWMASWKKYVFEPAKNCIFDTNALRDIAFACELKTHEHQISKSEASCKTPDTK